MKKFLFLFLIATNSLAFSPTPTPNWVLQGNIWRNGATGQIYYGAYPSGVNTFTPTPTPTFTRTFTPTFTPTFTNTPTVTPTPTGTQISGWTINATYAPQAFGTVTNQAIYEKRIGDTLYVRGKFEAGTVAGATASIRLPSNRTIDTTKFSNTANQFVGWAIRVFTAAGPTAHTTNASGQVVLFFDGSDTDDLFFSQGAGSDIFVKDLASADYSNSDTISFQFSVPVTEWSN